MIAGSVVASSVRRRRTSCLHCGTALPTASLTTTDDFCCRGCAEVYKLLHDTGLARYYELGGGDGHPVVRAEAASADHKWLEKILERLPVKGSSTSALTRIVLDVQGVHCAACVWLLERLFQKQKRNGAAQIIVNPAIGSIELTIGPEFPLAQWIVDVEAFGYRLGPPLKRESKAENDLVWRMGVCIAIAMNTMIFGFAIYCGLADGRVFRLFHALDFSLSLISVLVGGTVFFRSAWRAVVRRVVHLDLPIALGIALVFASSTYTYAVRGGATSYFDTLNVFIALMLVGRFLQERVLSKNRAMLLASDGAEGLYARRVSSSSSSSSSSTNAVALIRCTEIVEGDVLLVGRGDVVPVDATLIADTAASSSPAAALFSLDWISGESAPRNFAVGATIPAGAFSQGGRAVRLRALEAFNGSRLVSLLRTSTRRDEDVARSTSWHKKLTGIYVVAVLTIAAATFIAWLTVTRDLSRTLDVVAAVLIVTCPCAFGIATPLAYELAQAGLRRVGLFVRAPGFLDRAAEVTRVVFDKTGTLTTGQLVVSNPEAIAPAMLVDERDRACLFGLAVRSSHPKSRAIVVAMERNAGLFAFDGSLDVHEITGKGLELRTQDHLYRLGARAWALAPAKLPAIGARTTRGDVLFTRDGEVLAAIETREQQRHDAAEEVRALQREGYETYILSGDEPEATRAMARACGISDEHALGEHSPEAKAEWQKTTTTTNTNTKTLFIGDGINDSLVAEEAYCSGTPAIDRPFMASRCDFYFVTAGLRPIREALLTARRLARVVRRNLIIALLYNAVTVTLAVAGLMTPLLCAVLMPVSSLTTVVATTASLRAKTKTKTKTEQRKNS